MGKLKLAMAEKSGPPLMPTPVCQTMSKTSALCPRSTNILSKFVSSLYDHIVDLIHLTFFILEKLP